ncbi:DNA-binding XRE family transcriptional regulator [Streptomyces sp. 2333.5]|uniref:helix-turn-helix transcriptional regulator n=1 Tax=unclassified Streptomyces TaxID=2593676 RepID=UPI00089464F8|nr:MULTISPECIES: helix-turn-helix transcriptional regulator [unclassified Streptomyces]PJJ05525.1 DNA-binding XRE family transcriptional regulator [Streptomyces sp. 2333.5]SEE78124.1 DNA-binding transcriptional regulator, XRE-family HTH domain [Streptomyces sp. 2314.4]SEF00383.1 DNA-binding transcriptional regulator, XRE-family HTH domain [Streptomyces sp. 2112.2]
MTTAAASSPETTTGGDSTTGVGTLLREWRVRRRISQLELALRADSSARHISFIETGRSRPSQEMVLRLAAHLDVPVRERNALLIAAGYAPTFPETPLDDPSMAALRSGMERLLTGYEPFPALVMDGTYHVQAANRGITMLLTGVDPALLAPPLNAMRLTMHPGGLAPRIRNYREWRGHLLTQMERQLALLRSAPLRALYDEVSAYPLPPGGQESAGLGAHAPLALPMMLEHDGTVLSFLSTIATFNTPMDVTVSELAVETFLPADPETAEYLRGSGF